MAERNTNQPKPKQTNKELEVLGTHMAGATDLFETDTMKTTQQVKPPVDQHLP